MSDVSWRRIDNLTQSCMRPTFLSERRLVDGMIPPRDTALVSVCGHLLKSQPGVLRGVVRASQVCKTWASNLHGSNILLRALSPLAVKGMK
jgi:hypothetical protein